MDHIWILIVAMVGHILNVYADRLLFCTPSGKFNTSDLKDNEKMAVVFKTMRHQSTAVVPGTGTV